MRTAVIGVGYLGTFHAQKHKALSKELGFEFVGVCDSSLPQAEKVASDLGVKAFQSPLELLGKVDAVTIATSTPFHFELAKTFLSQKVHVNVEKPMTVTVAEGEELVALAERSNVHLAVGHSERFSPVFSALKKLAKSPQYLELNRHAPFKARGSEVSVVLDLMIHDIDLMLAMDSSEVFLESASCGSVVSSTEDWVQACFRFASGMSANISVSRVASTMTRTLKMIDADQVLVGNFQTGDLERGHALMGAIQFETQQVGKGDNLMLETRNFVLAIRGQEPLMVPGDQGLKALRLAQDVLNKGRR